MSCDDPDFDADAEPELAITHVFDDDDLIDTGLLSADGNQIFRSSPKISIGFFGSSNSPKVQRATFLSSARNLID